MTETHILAPADSRLLYDGVRVLTRLLAAAREHLGADAVVFGEIITHAPNLMWGTDGVRVFTVDDGWGWIFTAIEHWNAECVGWHVCKRGDRFAALQPISMGLARLYASTSAGAARGLALRMDHGSQYLSDHFTNQIKFWGIQPSYAFVEQPQTNGVAERFNRTLKEQIIHGRIYRNIAELRNAVRGFVEQYNAQWIVEKNGYLSPAQARQAWHTATPAPWAARWTDSANAYSTLVRRVMDQTVRRVLHRETVAAADKVVSLFEPHTDIVRKGGRNTYYGHKVNLATGRSGLVLDAVVESGNPTDSTRCLAMLERHREHYGVAPSHAAFDGGYASRDNLAQAKALGVRHAVFHKKSGLKAEDMTPSSWLYDQLKRFRAGIEAGISYLKRCFGLRRCRWRGLARFKAYVHSAIFTHNLMRLARLRLQPT